MVKIRSDVLPLLALATTYVTYVATRSDFPAIEWLRLRVFHRWDEGSWQAYLATCHWCFAFWAAGGVVGGTVLATGLPRPGLYWLANAAVTGVLLEVVDTLTHVRVRQAARGRK